MAETTETKGGSIFRVFLLFLATVGTCGLTTARPVAESDWQAAEPRYTSTATRQLREVYNLDACAWIRGGFGPNAGVCELNPQYGKVLLEITNQPLNEELFQEADCFISGLEECDSHIYCKWIPRSGDTPGRCIYKNAPAASKECSSEGMEVFSEVVSKCENRRVESCTRNPDCTLVGEDNGVQWCGVKASKALNLLAKSEIDQIALLRALIEGTRTLDWMDLPPIVPEGVNVPGQLSGRRLMQDAAGLSFGIADAQTESTQFNGLIGASADGTDDPAGGSFFGSDDGGVGFGILPAEDDTPSSQKVEEVSPSPPLNETDPAATPVGGKRSKADRARRGSPKNPTAEMKRDSESSRLNQTADSSTGTGVDPASGTQPLEQPIPKGQISTTTHTRPNATPVNTVSGTQPIVAKGKNGTVAAGNPYLGAATSGDNAVQGKGQVSVTAMTQLGASNTSGAEGPHSNTVQEGPRASHQGKVGQKAKTTTPSGSGELDTASTIQAAAADNGTDLAISSPTESDANLTQQPIFPVDAGADTVASPIEDDGSGAVAVSSSSRIPTNSTEGSRASSPDSDDNSFSAASDDPIRILTVEGDQDSQSAPPSVGGGRSRNTVVDVVPLAADGDNSGGSPSPGLRTAGFGVIAGSSITDGIGSNFRGKSSDETVLNPNSNNNESSEEENTLRAIMDAVHNMTKILHWHSSNAAPDTEEEVAVVKHLAVFLENLRYNLDANYTENSFSLWSEADMWWWKLQFAFQDLAENASPELPVLSSTACAMIAVAEEIRYEVNSRSLSNELHPMLDELDADLIDFTGECEAEEVPQSNGTENFEDMVKIVIKTIDESVSEVYPMRLDGEFASNHNQTWVATVAERSQKWNDIRQYVSAVSTVGTFVKEAVRGMLLTLPFVEEPGSDFLQPEGVQPAGPGATVSKVPEPRLDDLKLLMDDFSGVVAAIFKGNYTLAHSEGTPGLKDWQLGPVSIEIMKDAVERAVLKARLHPALEGNSQQLVVDGVVGIVLHAIGIMEAKVSPGAEHGYIILNFLDSVETLMKGWTGFINTQTDAESHDSFESTTAKATLNLAGCLALGGNSTETCSNVELPSTGEGCERREPIRGEQNPDFPKVPEMVCMPKRNDQLSGIEQHLNTVPQKRALAGGISDLFDAAALCAAREQSLCEADNMCITTTVAIGTRTQEVCEVASSFLNRMLVGKNVMGFVGKNKQCTEYLSRPKCTFMSSSADCSQAGNCIWRPAETRIMGLEPKSAYGAMNKGQGQLNQTAENALTGESASNSKNGVDETDEPGYCLQDWVAQMESILDGAQERVLVMRDKHTECKSQPNSDRCVAVDGEQEIDLLRNAAIPKANTSISKLVALSVSIGGTFLFVTLLAIVWKIVRGQRKAAEGKAKKCDGKKGKPKKKLRPHFHWLTQLWKRKGRKGKGKGKGKCSKMRKKKGEGKVPVATIRDWGQATVTTPPTFMSTSIMLSGPDEPSSLPCKKKSLNDFGFVLGYVEGSTDSQQSGINVAAIGGRRNCQEHITSEIEPANDSDRSDDTDSDTESQWSESEPSAWSDEEFSEAEHQHKRWSSPPRGGRVHEA